MNNLLPTNDNLKGQYNREIAEEYQDFKEFLSDHYFTGESDEFKECYSKFLSWLNRETIHNP